MRTSSSSSRSSKPWRALLVLVLVSGPGPVMAMDQLNAATLLSDGVFYQSVEATRHFYGASIFEKTYVLSNEEEDREVSFAEQHQLTWRWTLGYAGQLQSFGATAVPDGTQAAETDYTHFFKVGLGWDASPNWDIALNLRIRFAPAQEFRGGELSFLLGYVVPLRQAMLAFGIEPPKREPGEPESEEDLEARLLGGVRRPRGWSGPGGVEQRLDRFRFDPAVPMIFIGFTFESAKHVQERFHSKAEDHSIFQRTASLTLALVKPRWTWALTLKPYYYDTNVKTQIADLTATSLTDADYRGILSMAGGSPSVELEAETVWRPEAIWEVDLRAGLRTMASDGPTVWRVAPSLGRALGTDWAVALGGEVGFSTEATAVSGNLYLSYFL